MLRAPNLPCSSQIFVSTLRFPILSCVYFACDSSNPRFASLIRPIFTKTLHRPFLASPRFPNFAQFPSMEGSLRSQAKVRFSAGGSGGNKEILVHHLLVEEKDLKLLLELQQRIARGEDLSDLAVEYSLCPSKENGGMLGWVRRGQLVPEFEDAAFSASLNKIVRCKTKFGWHLLEVLSEREESILEDIEPVNLHSKMHDPNFIQEAQLIDVREHEEISQASLPGFKVLPLRQFGTWGSVITDEFNPEKDTYVLCHHGVRSLQVAKWLQTQGFKRVFNVSGGIDAFSLKADPSVPRY
ncbi:Rhodanese-like/PpiC domain-containing protein 12 [Platanthera guangdongensis]|uniref:Rhodanese-like/PpiC domain-containing protein 12 n=1 Tax=Platanthera guangdongensis TaxID=2320717 RepID=A0ABR2M6P6_9ASPA